MNDERIKELLQEKGYLENKNTALLQEIAELKLKEEGYIKTIKEQSAEMEQLRILARTVEKHFIENGSGWQVERCVGCGKCDYMVLEDSLAKALQAGKQSNLLIPSKSQD